MGTAACSVLHRNRVVFRPVCSQKAVTQTVKSVRRHIRREILIAEFLIEQIILDDILIVG